MTEDARAAILRALPRASEAPEASAEWRRPLPADGFDQAALAARFIAACAEHGVTVTREVGPGAARLSILSFLRSADARQVLVWPQDELPVPGLLDALQMLGIETVTPSAAAVSSRAILLQEKTVSFGMTTGLAGLADEGSILVHYPSAGAALAAAWPLTHVILLPTSRIVPSFEWWLAAARSQGQLVSWLQGDMTIIGGASLSMDIEQTLVRGAAGPARLHLFLIDEDIKL